MTIGLDNPFPGLRPFEAHQADLFFGRDEQVEELLDRLERTRFLAVVGTSDSGKSSLMKAGLIPALRRGYFGGLDWKLAVFRPGSNPIAELATAVSGTYQTSRSEALTTLKHSSLGLVDLTRQHNHSGQSLLIVVDQFEELFRYRKETNEPGGKEESAAFVKLLLTATGRSEVSLPDSAPLPIYVVLTMRSDFLGKCSQFRGLPEALNNSQYLVPRMTRVQQREAIEGPIGMAGARITPQLVQRMLNDTGDDSDQLPVLQHALMRTWVQSRTAREEGTPIDLAHYESVGGMERALNEDADRALAELGDDPQGEAISRRLFQCIVQSGAEDEETRRPMPVSEIVAVTGASEDEVRQVIGVFERSGFLMLSEDADPVIDVSHESLIRLWRRLKDWVQEETASAQIYLRLAESASKGLALYRDPELTQALRWRDWRNPNAEWARRYSQRDPVAFSRAMDFLTRSRNARASDQWIRRALVTGLCVLSIALGFAAFLAWKNAQDAILRRIAAEASLLFRENDIETSTILAVEAMTRRPIPAYDQALRRYSALVPKQIASLAHNSRVNCVAFSPNGRYVVSASDDHTARLLDLPTGKEILRLNHPGPVRAVAFSRDGRYIATGSDDHIARVFDSTTGRELSRVVFDYGVIAMQFSPDGRYLASGGEDWTARVLEVATGKEVVRLNHSSRVVALAFSPDGRYLASGSADRKVRVTEVATGRQISLLVPNTEAGAGMKLEFRGSMARAAVAFTADGHHVIRAINDDVSVFETFSGKELSHIAQESVVFAVAFSPSSRLAATASQDGAIHLFEVLSGREVSRFTIQGDSRMPLGSLAFSPDERFVASGHGDVAQVFEIATGRERARAHPGELSALSFSPNSQSWATAGTDGVTRVFEVVAHGDARVLPRSGKIYAMALSQDGRYVAAAHAGTVCLFETTLGRQV